MNENFPIFSKISRQKTSELMKIPENYFENFSEQIESKISEEIVAEKKTLSIKIVPYLSMAAGFLLIVGLWMLFFKFIPIEKTKTAQISSQQQEDIDLYNTDIETVYAVMSDENTADTTNMDEEIIEYLSESSESSDFLALNDF